MDPSDKTFWIRACFVNQDQDSLVLVLVTRQNWQSSRHTTLTQHWFNVNSTNWVRADNHSPERGLIEGPTFLSYEFQQVLRSGLKAPAEPSCRPTWFIFQYHLLWRFFKNKYYLKSLHRLKAISGRLIIIVNSYNLILIAISLRFIKMSINRLGCGLQENDDFLEINAFLIKIP